MRALTSDIAESTIVACATPIAPSAIAVIRLSGEKAVEILRKLTGIEKIPHAYIKRAVLDTGELKDSVMAAVFYAPRSYTGEDCVELYTHGSPAIIRNTIEFCVKNGARLAEGGEFTRRAYLNGKMDLSSAEGINDIIHSETAAQVNAAYSIAEGFLYRQCKDLSDRIVAVAAAIQAGLDYPDEVASPEERDYKAEINAVCDDLIRLRESYNVGKKLGEGITVALVGRVNAGKSSLFNALLNDDRAIVDESEGTTRDVIDAFMEYRGMKFVLLDTAGFRETSDKVENKGIDRSKKLIGDADIIIEVLGEGDERSNISSDGERIAVRTRADLGVKPKGDEISVSSVSGYGIDKLKEKLYKVAAKRGIVPRSDVVTNLRHFTALGNCLDSLTELLKNYDTITDDVITIHLRDALDALSLITGLVGSDEILDEIFSSFCVGK